MSNRTHMIHYAKPYTCESRSIYKFTANVTQKYANIFLKVFQHISASIFQKAVNWVIASRSYYRNTAVGSKWIKVNQDESTQIGFTSLDAYWHIFSQVQNNWHFWKSLWFVVNWNFKFNLEENKKTFVTIIGTQGWMIQIRSRLEMFFLLLWIYLVLICICLWSLKWSR